MEKTAPSPVEIAAQAGNWAFGRPVINNVFRGLVAEVIVAHALAPDWKRPEQDWAPHDLESGRFKLEVKQSADRQTWDPPERKRPPRFDIAPRTDGRAAHVYVLALHIWPVDAGDQRDPAQWQFLVIPVDRLAERQRSIGWASALKLAPAGAVGWKRLAQAVAQCQEAMRA
jgi:hypothetical protein